MARNISIISTSPDGEIWRPHGNIDQYGFPITFSPTVGCTLGCRYCFSPKFVAKVKTCKRKKFFENIRVKTTAPQKLDRALTKISDVPQHLKRIQINEACEYYTPELIHAIKAGTKPDTLKAVLEIFEKHWNKGNKWMLHILTKSHHVLFHLDILARMRHMVQVEFSFMHYDDKVIRQYEFFTPSIQKRLDAIQQLTKSGIFVRTMAMPFLGNQAEALILRDLTFNAGAQAFKHKQLNYYDWNQLRGLPYSDLMADNVVQVKGCPNLMFTNLIVKSGEEVLTRGLPTYVIFDMPIVNPWAVRTKKRHGRLAPTKVAIIDCGYTALNGENWGYIR